MADRANKFKKDFKSKYNSNATEEIVQGLVELSEIEKNSNDENKKETAEEKIKSVEVITEVVENIDKTQESKDAPEEKKEIKRSAKKSGKKSNAGRKPFKMGDYKKITIDIPQEIYDAMQDFLGAFDNNMTSYIKSALANDINANYEEYVKKAQATKESAPILRIKRK